MQEIPEICFELNLNRLTKEACAQEGLKQEDWLPTRANPEDVGYDCRSASVEDIVLRPGCLIKVPLGFSSLIPSGWWLNVHPRSSTFGSRNIISHIGIIDSTYPNEVVFMGRYEPDACKLLSDTNPLTIKFGERVCQILPVKRESMKIKLLSSAEMKEAREARPTTRIGGLGSSGAK